MIFFLITQVLLKILLAFNLLHFVFSQYSFCIIHHREKDPKQNLK